MAWRASKPAGRDSLRISDDLIRDNFEALEEVISVSHVFSGATRGAHYPGLASVCDVQTEDTLTGYADVAGAICWPTDLDGFWTNNGAGWDSRGAVEAGSIMPFFQATAPEGWTLVTTAYDGMMMATSGGGILSGGQVVAGGTWTVSGVTLDHYHGMTEVPYHTHSYTWGALLTLDGLTYLTRGQNIVHHNFSTSTDGTANATTQGKNVTMQSDSTWRPQSIIMILASKD